MCNKMITLILCLMFNGLQGYSDGALDSDGGLNATTAQLVQLIRQNPLDVVQRARNLLVHGANPDAQILDPINNTREVSLCMKQCGQVMQRLFCCCWPMVLTHQLPMMKEKIQYILRAK